ncbi:hypothetical protein KVR01_008181 [Diaporthe batatas]|uniref:uncharacterized protein n=1 Tax=Diaporthe batatas TaxID=748121 RepID=UPI001D05B8E5|nr:uncharacterized protein KVR01_008181 [Diaporthe batatas]KAG8162416.1 hypothetical protein KVR01_008181 [Diaporthe batatas]
MDYGYGYRGSNNLLRLPYLRLLFSGPLVPMFFILSGYILSKKPLHLSGSAIVPWEGLTTSLAGSTFRRGLRLFLPPTFSTFGVMLLVRFGLFSFPYETMPGRIPDHPDFLDSTARQLWDWVKFVVTEMTNPWTWTSGHLIYGPHLWTIPISFQGSLVTYLTCLALLRVKASVRLMLIALVILHAIILGRIYMSLFFGGMLLSGIEVYQSTSSHLAYIATYTTRLNTPSRFWTFLLLVCGGYIGSFPRDNHHGQCVSGYQTICEISTDYHPWHALGAFLIFSAIWRETQVQSYLEAPLLQYFGKISFSLYIIHEPLLHVFGFFTVQFIWNFTGKETILQYQAGLILAMAVNFFVLVWLADLFWRHIEGFCARIASLVERSAFAV